MDIVCLGELLVDMFPAEMGRRLADVSAFYPKPGGAPANVAVAAARLGASSAFVGQVGDDAFGRHLAGVLAAHQVNVRGVRYDCEARTTMAFIAKPDENTSEYVFYRNPGADTRLSAGDLDRELLSGTRALHFGSLSLCQEPIRSATEEAVRVARAGRALVSFDVNYRPSLWRRAEDARAETERLLPWVDLVKVNEGELELLTGGSDLDRGARELLDRGPSLCVVTLGPQGSYFATRHDRGFVPGYHVTAVDATGCGDAFVAGLLVRLVSGAAPGAGWEESFTEELMQSALRYANAVGALTATQPGAIPSLPTAPQVDEFLLHACLTRDYPGARGL